MSTFTEHCEQCEKEFGESFHYVHRWLDEFFIIKGPTHRKIRHHWEGIEEVRIKWGDKAAKAAELHLKEDMYSLPIPHETDYIGSDGSWPIGQEWNSNNND